MYMPIQRSGTTEQRLAILETVQDGLYDLAQRTDNRMDRIEKVIWQAVGAVAIIAVAAQVVIPILLDKLGVVPV